MKILLLGGDGYIGNYIVKHFKNQCSFYVLNRNVLYTPIDGKVICKSNDPNIPQIILKLQLDTIVNLISNIDALSLVISILSTVKKKDNSVFVIHIASISEFACNQKSHYADNKTQWKDVLFQDNLVDTIFYCGMVYGENPRMEKDLKKYKHLLLGTSLSYKIKVNIANIYDICSTIMFLCTNIINFQKVHWIYYLGSYVNIQELYQYCKLSTEIKLSVPKIIDKTFLRIIAIMFNDVNNTMKYRIYRFIKIANGAQKTHYDVFHKKYQKIKTFDKVETYESYELSFVKDICFIKNKGK